MTTALAPFAGVGFGVACDRMGIHELGIENDRHVLATRDSAGMITFGRDALALALSREPLWYELLTAGPPCQTFSTVGRGHGRKDLEAIQDIALSMANPIYSTRWLGYAIKDLYIRPDEDQRTALVLVPLLYALRDMPRSIVLEQVPAVLPVWEAYAYALRAHGYHVWTGVLNAEQYGVPQTRKRAVLLASLDHHVMQPRPTHSKYYVRDPERLDPGVKPWVSMADALGFPEGVVGFPRLDDGRDEGIELDDVRYRKRDLRLTARPSWGVTSKTRSWRRWGFTARPATTVTGHGTATRHPSGVQNAHLKAIEAGTFELRDPYTITTAKLPSFDNISLSRSYRGDSVNITLEEGAVLQTFPDDFPFEGGNNRKWETIGNAVPPLLAEHLIRAVL